MLIRLLNQCLESTVCFSYNSWLFVLISFQAETAQQTASEKFEHISEVAKQGQLTNV